EVPDSPARQEVIDQLIATAVGVENEPALNEMLTLIAPPEGKSVESWQLAALSAFLNALNRKGRNLDSLASSSKPEAGAALAHIKQAMADARGMAQNGSVDEATRMAAIGLLGRSPAQFEADLDLLKRLLALPNASRLQTAAVGAL